MNSALRCAASRSGVVEDFLEIGVEVRPTRVVQDSVYPGIALEPDHLKIPHACGHSFGRATEFERLIERGGENMMVEFVLVRPPVNKNEIGIAPAVNANKADAVIVSESFWQDGMRELLRFRD